MGIEGYIYFNKDKGIEACYKKQNKIIKELSDLFPNAKKVKRELLNIMPQIIII